MLLAQTTAAPLPATTVLATTTAVVGATMTAVVAMMTAVAVAATTTALPASMTVAAATTTVLLARTGMTTAPLARTATTTAVAAATAGTARLPVASVTSLPATVSPVRSATSLPARSATSLPVRSATLTLATECYRYLAVYRIGMEWSLCGVGCCGVATACVSNPVARLKDSSRPCSPPCQLRHGPLTAWEDTFVLPATGVSKIRGVPTMLSYGMASGPGAIVNQRGSISSVLGSGESHCENNPLSRCSLPFPTSKQVQSSENRRVRRRTTGADNVNLACVDEVLR